MVYNFQLLKYIGEDGVSAYGVLMYVQFIFVAIYIGYSVGCAPVIGYHYGAGNRDELKNLLRKSALLIGSAGVLLTLLARLLASPLASIFVGYRRDATRSPSTRSACSPSPSCSRASTSSPPPSSPRSTTASSLRRFPSCARCFSRPAASSSCPCCSTSTASGGPSRRRRCSRLRFRSPSC